MGQYIFCYFVWRVKDIVLTHVPLLFSSFHVEETAPILAVWLIPLQNKGTGAQQISRSAHLQPSASWTCTGASVPSSCPRAPGHLGDILGWKGFGSYFIKITWNIDFVMIVNISKSSLTFSIKRSASPCLSSRSSPLLAAPRSPCPEGPPEPFSDGAEIQVANLDYRMSRKDLQQTLHDTFSRYGRVRLTRVILLC